MSDQQVTEMSSMTEGGDSSETVVVINIKTLDSQVFSFQVDKNMLVSEFKEMIASQVGLPVAQQRLIYRGRVLKDNHALSEYHVESGHTLHLVARQPAETQPSSGTNSGEASSNNGQGPIASEVPPRIGQISHSVVLGTLNVGDQGEGVPDISQVIGAVLNSIGLGGQYAAGANGAPANMMGGPQPILQVRQGNQMEGTPSNMGTQSQAGTRPQPTQAFPGPPLPQVLQIPLGAAVQVPVGASIPMPSIDVPIPNSLRTLSEFISHMELALSQSGSQPNESQNNTGDEPAVDVPVGPNGLPTAEALMTVLRQAQRLLGDRTVASLSHITERLEQEGSSTDINVRGQIQREAMQLGLTMQHLGSLLLELGRTMMLLRMGQSPAEALVHAGPAVYISSSRPNPIMVQPFPMQTSSLFGGSAAPSNSGNFGPIGIGSAPRHVNIHIHTAMGPRTAPNADGAQGGRNRPSSVNSGQTRLHPRNVNAAVVPPQPPVTVTSASQTGAPPVSQSLPGSDQISSIVAEINSRLRNLTDNTLAGNQASSNGQAETSAVQDPPARSDYGNIQTNNQLEDLVDPDASDLSSSLGHNLGEDQKVSLGGSQSNNSGVSLVSSKDVPPSSSSGGSNELLSGEAAQKLVSNFECTLASGQGSDKGERATTVPLGLGLGGLQPKRKGRKSKIQGKASDSTSIASDQNQQVATNSQQIMQSLTSMTSQRSPSNFPLSVQGLGGVQSGEQGPEEGQIDVANAMTEVLHSPAFDDLLSGVSQQAGVGSPNVLRNMLEQFTCNPAMMNTVSQIAQQFDGQDVGNMLSGIGRGEGGGLDLAGMVQQMMPIVSQALGGGPMPLQQRSPVFPNLQLQSNVRSSSRDENPSDPDSQIDLQPVLQIIENHDPPEEIFRSLAATAAGTGGASEDLLNELCSEGGLANEFMEAFRRDIRNRLQSEKEPSDIS